MQVALKEYLCHFVTLFIDYLFISFYFYLLPLSYFYVRPDKFPNIPKSLYITARFVLKFFVDNTVIFGMDIGLRQATGEAIFLISQN